MIMNDKVLSMEGLPELSASLSESFNTLSTTLFLRHGGKKKLLIASAQSGDGKTFAALHMLRTMARLGKKVLFLDADLKRSSFLADYFFPEDGTKLPGLIDFLDGKAEKSEIVYKTSVEKTYILPSGGRSEYSLALLNKQKFCALLAALAEEFDYILIDSSAVLEAIDAAQIAQYCDGVLLIVKFNALKRADLLKTKERLSLSNCPILGAVLNKVKK